MDGNVPSMSSKARTIMMQPINQNQDIELISDSRDSQIEMIWESRGQNIEIIRDTRSPQVEMIYDSRESQIEMIWDSRVSQINQLSEAHSESDLQSPFDGLNMNHGTQDQTPLYPANRMPNIMIILHALKCKKQKPFNRTMKKCNKPHCKNMKMTLNHLKTCQVEKNCSVKLCFATKYILRHWKNCKNQNCPRCEPLKRSDRKQISSLGSFLQNENHLEIGAGGQRGPETSGSQKAQQIIIQQNPAVPRVPLGDLSNISYAGPSHIIGRKQPQPYQPNEGNNKENSVRKASEQRVSDDDDSDSTDSGATFCEEVESQKLIIMPYIDIGMIGGTRGLETSYLCDSYKILDRQDSEVERYTPQGFTVSTREQSQVIEGQQSHSNPSPDETGRSSIQKSPVGANRMIDVNQEIENIDGTSGPEFDSLNDSLKIPDKRDSEIDGYPPESLIMSPRTPSQVIEWQISPPNLGPVDSGNRMIHNYPDGTNRIVYDNQEIEITGSTGDLENEDLSGSQKTSEPHSPRFQGSSPRVPNITPGEQSQKTRIDSHSHSWLHSSPDESISDDFGDVILNGCVSQQSQTLDVVHESRDYPYAIPMKYDTDGGVRGVVHIFNYYEFTEEEKNFLGGEKDGDRLLEEFKHLQFKVKIHKNLNKAETDMAFQDIQQTEGLADENMIIFFILSHGVDENTFLSSDCEVIDLQAKMVLFRKDNCSAMKHKPQAWFGDFCRGAGHQRGVGSFSRKDSDSGHDEYYGRTEVFSNMLYVMSSNPGIASIYEDGGSSFSIAICKMLKEGKYALDDMWFMELNVELRANKCPNTVRHTYDPFPGQLFYPEGFSLGYDVDEINKKKT